MLDSRVRAFLSEARALAGDPDSALTESNPHLQYILAESLGDLPLDLDAVVKQYTLDVERGHHVLAQLTALILGVNLTVLGLLAVLVFRPMVRRIDRDMTDMKGAREKFERIVEDAPDAMIFSDREGMITLANAQTENLFGYSRVELIGKPLEMLLPGRFQGNHRQLCADYLVNPTRRPMDIGPSRYARRRDGREFPVDVSLSPLETEEGLLISSAVRDITPRKEAEEQLRKHALDLARINARLEQFAYVAAHDLQEPLRIVVSYAQMLQRRYERQLGPEADEFIGYIVGGSTRMQNLVRDLLSYSRAGGDGGSLAAVNSAEALDQAIENLRSAIQESEAVITRDALPTVVSDATQLVLVFQNLLGNAVKFRSERPPQIHVSAERDGGAWRFSVQDNGIGIKSEHTDRIFDIFKRLHGRGEYPGTGIGLAICKKIVEGFGGRIWVESRPGEGSTFYFTIPTT